jgi:hypothetical protein
LSYEKIREICFGCLRINPVDFYEYKISDLWTMLKGWDDKVMFDLKIQKTMTAIIAEVTNRTMGGKGVWDAINRIIPIDEKEKKIEYTPEQITYMIQKHNHNMMLRREEAKKKKDNEKS